MWADDLGVSHPARGGFQSLGRSEKDEGGSRQLSTARLRPCDGGSLTLPPGWRPRARGFVNQGIRGRECEESVVKRKRRPAMALSNGQLISLRVALSQSAVAATLC